MPADDSSLVRGMLAGEESAFDAFFKSCFPPLFRFAMARMRDPEAAEDVVQATLCRAVTRLRSFRGEAALLTWLTTLCRHEMSAYYGRRERAPAEIDLIEEIPEVRAALESLTRGEPQDPEAAMRRRQLADLVQETLDRLPRHYGDALEWKYLEGLSLVEIAARLGVSPKAAESCLTRARQAFREGFSAVGGMLAARQE
jgi:RNA polymerase sigma-70 factor (ECF subfamily)